MNAAARALAAGSWSGLSSISITISRQMIGVILLIISVLASALAVVYVEDLDRQLFSQLQTLKQQRDELHSQWGQLLLEQNTWAAPARVQAIAQQQLGMLLPAPKDVQLVTLGSAKNGSAPSD